MTIITKASNNTFLREAKSPVVTFVRLAPWARTSLYAELAIHGSDSCFLPAALRLRLFAQPPTRSLQEASFDECYISRKEI